MNFKEKALQIAVEMQRNKKFYTRQGLASAMGIQYQYAAKVFTELQSNGVYTLETSNYPTFSIKVTRLSQTKPVTRYDVKASRNALLALNKHCWDLALGVNAPQGV